MFVNYAQKSPTPLSGIFIMSFCTRLLDSRAFDTQKSIIYALKNAPMARFLLSFLYRFLFYGIIYAL